MLHLTRRSVAFELYNPYSIVQLSEVLSDLRIVREGRPLYQGRAVVTTLVPTGAVTIVSAALVDAWSDLQNANSTDAIRAETERFISGWEQSYRLTPAYQLAVGALSSFLQELSRWLDQADAVYTNEATEAPSLPEGLLRDQVWPLVQPKLTELVSSFETEASRVPAEQVPIHKAFAQRELHPLLLCDPFFHRSFTKPLGYAGDYQMVNMILGTFEAPLNSYARVLNIFNLNSAPANAHRNRIRILRNILRREARRRAQVGKPFRVLNVGCGPAGELHRFVTTDDFADSCDLTLIDFNAETLDYVQKEIGRTIEQSHRHITLRFLQRSIHELLEEAASGKMPTSADYDLVYCAGLFDYLSDRVCKNLVRLYYDAVAPGGAVVVTNVHARNPIRYYMEHVAEWYLVYRDDPQMLRLAPEGTDCRVFSDPTAVNVFLELRKPEA